MKNKKILILLALSCLSLSGINAQGKSPNVVLIC